MKKILYSLSFLIILIFFIISCEQPLEEEEFPYDLKLVIRGVIEPNKLINDIYIGRTLPVSLPYSEEFAIVKDAVGAILVDNVSYPLRHIAKGIYSTDSLFGERGKEYTLLLRWENKSAYATTKIPVIGNISAAYVSQKIIDDENRYYLESTINPFSNEVYAATWALLNLSGVIVNEAKEFESVIKPMNNNIKVPTVPVPTNILNSGGPLAIKIYIFDSAYYDYYITQGSNLVSDAIFGQPGSNIRWNVMGDGIGMFIGKADTLKLINN